MTKRAVFHSLRVRAISRLTADSAAVTFEVPEELREDYRFTPGQHVTVRTSAAGDDVRRNYSICSATDVQIGVKYLDGGGFSSYVKNKMKPGDTVDVMTPTGRFSVTTDLANERQIACVAAGSGITPILSMITAVLRDEPKSRVTLYYGNRVSASVMFLEELADLKDRYLDRFQIVHVLSREHPEIELLGGRIDETKLERLSRALMPVTAVDEWYLCGPLAMVDELREALLAWKVPRDRVHSELFHVGPPARPAAAAESNGAVDDCEVTAILDGRRSTFPLARKGAPVLEGVLSVREDAPFACRGGVCGTCRARVVEGEVTMDQCYALEPEEVARGFVLTCQSHPTTDKLVVDYDA